MHTLSLNSELICEDEDCRDQGDDIVRVKKQYLRQDIIFTKNKLYKT